jgi:hypothetical protein
MVTEFLSRFSSSSQRWNGSQDSKLLLHASVFKFIKSNLHDLRSTNHFFFFSKLAMHCRSNQWTKIPRPISSQYLLQFWRLRVFLQSKGCAGEPWKHSKKALFSFPQIKVSHTSPLLFLFFRASATPHVCVLGFITDTKDFNKTGICVLKSNIIWQLRHTWGNNKIMESLVRKSLVLTRSKTWRNNLWIYETD